MPRAPAADDVVSGPLDMRTNGDNGVWIRLLRRARRRLRGEDGFALVLALGLLTVLSLAATSALYYSSRAPRQADYSAQKVSADALALAGLNNAVSVLNNPSNNALDPVLLPQRTSCAPNLGQTCSAPYGDAYVVWSGTIDALTAVWKLTATGYARNKNEQPGKYETRTITARVPVVPTLQQPLNNPAWNWILARQTGNTCDMSIGQTVAVGSPLYVAGNLCLNNQATIVRGPLVVGGKLSMNTNQNSVGSSASPVSEAHVGNGCQLQSTSQSPCTGGSSVHVWATKLDSTPAIVAAPVVDWDAWYLNANPGPYYPCATSSGTPPTFDNDQGTIANASATYRNNSLPTVFNLTPNASYTCKTAAGEISWNATTRVLTVNGTIFVDGSLTVNNGLVNSYSGFATVYLSGTLLIKNSKLCAVVTSDGTNCATSGWTSNQQMLAFVAGGNGSSAAPQNQVASGDGIQLVSSYFQGAMMATNAIDVDTSSQVDGPLDGSTVKLGQSVNSSWPAFTVVPAGLPGNPTVYAQPNPPQSFSG